VSRAELDAIERGSQSPDLDPVRDAAVRLAEAEDKAVFHGFNAAGIEGLKSRRSPGRSPALSAAQRAELRALVAAGPDPSEHQVVRWRCVDLQAEVARRFCVEVHENTIGRWLHELGFTRLQPRPSHPRKSAEAEEAFKKTLSTC